ncbi:DUF1289 domain-containing protein [Neptuniibacter halophilus]|uniref:DUF1289 domain-containing protein n=1 Tax=Neptuniibacter halophilus TaxID=651666 RepID=UPI002572F8BF|nr:DUF1289 domain-containing protein [Neptuniibacter halophilus]
MLTDPRKAKKQNASPCIRNCCLDDNDVCLGCYRSLSEILAWSEESEEEKAAILRRTKERRSIARLQLQS